MTLPEFGPPTLTVPFRLRGYAGTAAFYYTVNDDPAFWGFDLLALPFDLETVKGFPVFAARLDFPAPGYRAVLGWLQCVAVTPFDAPHRTDLQLDVLPQQYPVTYPASLSYQPAIFDAPGPNPPRNHERWQARTYLVGSPDIGRSPCLFALLGVTWGYDLIRGQVSVHPLKALGEAAWQQDLAFLERECPDWTFRRTWGEGEPSSVW